MQRLERSWKGAEQLTCGQTREEKRTLPCSSWEKDWRKAGSLPQQPPEGPSLREGGTCFCYSQRGRHFPLWPTNPVYLCWFPKLCLWTTQEGERLGTDLAEGTRHERRQRCPKIERATTSRWDEVPSIQHSYALLESVKLFCIFIVQLIHSLSRLPFFNKNLDCKLFVAWTIFLYGWRMSSTMESPISGQTV